MDPRNHLSVFQGLQNGLEGAEVGGRGHEDQLSATPQATQEGRFIRETVRRSVEFQGHLEKGFSKRFAKLSETMVKATCCKVLPCFRRVLKKKGKKLSKN